MEQSLPANIILWQSRIVAVASSDDKEVFSRDETGAPGIMLEAECSATCRQQLSVRIYMLVSKKSINAVMNRNITARDQMKPWTGWIEHGDWGGK